MVIRRIDAVAELTAAAQLLYARWTLALPTAIASLLAGVILLVIAASMVASAIGAGAAASGHAGVGAAFLGAGMLSILIGGIAFMVLVGFAEAVVMAAAEDAWQGRAPDFGGAVGRTRSKAVTLVTLFVLVLLLAIIPFALSFVVIGIPLLLALGFFLMFALPAVMIGDESATGAIMASFRLARAHLGPALAAFVAIIIASVLGRVVDAAFLHIPILGLIATFFVGGITSAYSALVAVRFYDVLRQMPIEANAPV